MAPKSKVSTRFPSQDVFFGTSPDLPRIVELDCEKVVWNPDQPRKRIDPVKLQELADSISTHGLIHPITVQRSGTDQYMVISGERRFRAFGLLERTSIPAIISDGSTNELALIENIQREDLSPIDEYQAVARLMDKHGYSQGEVASALGKSRVSINEIMSLAGLTTPILDEARSVNVSKSILVEIARAGNEAAQRQLWDDVRAGVNTVRALRARKKPITEPAQQQSPIDTAIRAGKRFASALAAISAEENSKLAGILSLVERSLAVLNDQSDASISIR